MSAILEFKGKPSLLPAYVKVFTGGRQRYAGLDSIPKLEARWSGATEAAAKIQAYREACGFKADGQLPLLYPHILTSAMHIHMLADKRFPASALGAVHARNHIVQHRAIAETEPLDLRCYFHGARVLKAGLEVDVATEVLAGGACVWESVSAYLFRGRKYGAPGEAHAWAALDDLGDSSFEASWSVPKDMGRRYAGITGDYNPIHVSRILAKLFGFPRDIIHGMWSLARCMAHLEEVDFAQALQLDAIFKGPIFIGSETDMKAHPVTDGFRADVFCRNNPRPCIVASLRRVSGQESLLQ